MKILSIDGAMLKKALVGSANLLEKNKEEVNKLNVFPVPDGDTGTNMHLTIKSAVNQVLKVDDNSIGKIANASSVGSLMGARGNSGVILSQLFRGFANGLKDKSTANTTDLAEAFKIAADTAYKAVMKPTEGTILTVANECAKYSESLAKTENDIVIFMEEVIKYGNEVLSKTPDMLPVLKEAGVVDAGGNGLMVILAGAYNAIVDKDIIDFDMLNSDDTIIKKEPRIIKGSDIEFGYCTEFRINTMENNYQPFRDELSQFGDSLLVVGGEGIIKVHVHTNNPGKVLEKALGLGELDDIKIDNMRYQHEHTLNEDEIQTEKEHKKYSFIAVSAGEGLDSVFKELNVDHIIHGGQTMNPSTEDILNAISEISADNIIVFPNNGNIILAAEQAKDLSEKSVFIVPTKTIPEGVACLISFDPELSIDENLENMSETIQNVKTGQITYSVRDSEMNGKKIKRDDIIGISKDDVISNGNDIEEVSFELVNNLVNEDSSLITIFYGEGISEDEANGLANRVEEEFDDYDIEVIFGGQPIYYYIISVE